MSQPAYTFLETRKGRIVFVHLPVTISMLIIIFLFSLVSRDWSDLKAVVWGSVIIFVWIVFVAVPLFILIAPPKKK